MAANSLNSVVSSLVRASMGTSVPDSVTDEDLDRHVQELILKEAKKKAEQYADRGVRAYLPEREDKQPRANKRFLTTIIRHTDDHNKAILRAQSDAALEAKAEREEQERKERRARAAEATEAERMRLRRRSRDDEAWAGKRDSGRRRRRRSRSYDRDSDVKERDRARHKHRARSRSPSRREKDENRPRREERERAGDNPKKHRSSHRRGRERSNSRTSDKDKHKACNRISPSSRGSDQSPGPSLSSKNKGKGLPSLLSSEEVEEQAFPKASSSTSSRIPSSFDLSAQFESRKAKAASPPPPVSPTLSEEEDIERLRPRRRRRASPRRKSPSPQSASVFSSKMDKYFEQSYDPRLDTGPMTLPEVPASGLIDGAEFESWEAMLDIIRQRREDKAERKRLERAGLIPGGDREKGTGSKAMTSTSGAWTMDAGDELMNIQYSKRGSVREWDVGKEGF